MEQERTKKKEIPYPKNLLEEIDRKRVSGQHIEWKTITEDQITGLNYVLGMLSDREQDILRLRYQEKLTFSEIGKKHEISRERVRQIHNLALRKMRKPSWEKWYVYGMSHCKAELDEERTNSGKMEKKFLSMSLLKLGIPTRIVAAFQRIGIYTVRLSSAWPLSVYGPSSSCPLIVQ